MNVQAAVVAILDDALDDTFLVAPGLGVPDAGEPGIRYVRVYRTSISHEGMPAGARRHDLTIDVITAHTDDLARADADLADAVDAVLDVLDTDPDLPGLEWDTVDRVVLGEQFHTMQISAWCITTTESEE